MYNIIEPRTVISAKERHTGGLASRSGNPVSAAGLDSRFRGNDDTDNWLGANAIALGNSTIPLTTAGK
jgi:hypothetical protein